MANYYLEQKQAFLALDNKIRNGLESEGKINTTKAILELTAEYAVSEKALTKRVESYTQVNSKLRLEQGWLIENAD